MLQGLGYLDITMTLARICVGVLFWLSGGWKLFNPVSHANLLTSITTARIPFPRTMAWLVAFVEYFAGWALIVGLLTPLAAFGLMVICIVASCTEYWRKQIEGNAMDKIGEILFFPEVLLILLLALIIAYGSGPYSADTVVTIAIAASL